MGVRSSITGNAHRKSPGCHRSEAALFSDMQRERSHHCSLCPHMPVASTMGTSGHLLEWAGVALAATSGPSHLVGSVPQLVTASAPSCLGRPTHP